MPKKTLAERKKAAMELLQRASDAYFRADASINEFIRGDKRLTVENLQLLKGRIYRAESDGQRAVADALSALEGF